jgi:hypothetical protein
MWAGHVARMGEKKNAYTCDIGGRARRPLGRPRRKWMDIIKMILEG